MDQIKGGIDGILQHGTIRIEQKNLILNYYEVNRVLRKITFACECFLVYDYIVIMSILSASWFRYSANPKLLPLEPIV